MKILSFRVGVSSLCITVLSTLGGVWAATETSPSMVPGVAALTVQTTLPKMCNLSVQIDASGNIVPWQEARIDSMSNGLAVAKILVNVGDTVKKNQVLGTFDQTSLKASLESARANYNAAKADYEQAKDNAKQNRSLISEGFISQKAARQSFTDEKTSADRMASAKANVDIQTQLLRNSEVRAPAAGIITKRSVNLGAVMGAGQELFRMIVNGRLEWQAQMQSVDLPSIHRGDAVQLTTTGGVKAHGSVRMIGPSVDPNTRLGTVYVDIKKPKGHGVEAGMFAQGHFIVGQQEALVVPPSAILSRDGFNYVFVMKDARHVRLQKIQTGERSQNIVQVTSGLEPTQTIVSIGAGFLNDGDVVRVNNAVPAAKFSCPAIKK